LSIEGGWELDFNITIYWVLSKSDLEENKDQLVETGNDESDTEGQYVPFENPISSKEGNKPIYCLEFIKKRGEI